MDILGQFDFWRAMTGGALSLLYSNFIDGVGVLRYPQLAIMQAGISGLSIFVAQRVYAMISQLFLSQLSGSLAGKAQEYFMEPIFAGVLYNWFDGQLGGRMFGSYSNFMRGFVLDIGSQKFETSFKSLFNGVGATTVKSGEEGTYMYL